MRKKSKIKKPKFVQIYAENERALRELTTMKHRDLQRACILRGLPPMDVVGLSHPKLVSWFIANYENSQDENLLLEFDAFAEEELVKRGYKVGESLLSPCLKFSYVGNIEEMEKPKLIKADNKAVPEKKEKATMNDSGVRSGTKKALTYKLAIEKVDINKIIAQVKEKFPEAKEKSIKIWAKRAIKNQ